MDPQLWQACAGNMVQIPPVNSKVFYFPQGHIEHYGSVTSDLKNYPNLPAVIPCTVSSITFLADPETDDVYAKIKLVPLGNDFGGDDGGSGGERPVSFSKTLTQSDANNGGGFSVPRYCAETIFPRLDYNADPPVQTIVTRDVHGVVWKFRHIYRGTPRRHLLTTGWSNFVNKKKLVAGDSIVFLRAENGDLCVGIRRPKRGVVGGGVGCLSGWNNGSCGLSYGGFLGYGEGKLVRNYDDLVPNGKVKVETLVEAANLVANGEAFEVVYYPRWGTPEFFVKASVVKAAMQVKWSGGMRFKMAFETEDSSRISWFMGTVSSVQVADPIRWPNSPWRLLQVAWDEPELLQNVKKVNPWLVELVATLPTIHMSPLSPPRKKLRLPPASDFPFTDHLPIPPFPSSTTVNPLRPVFGLPDNSQSCIQGARHSQFGHFTSDFYSNKVNEPRPKYPNINFIEKPLIITKNSSSFLTMATSEEESLKKSISTTAPFMLFGKPILTEKQISESSADSTKSSLSETSSSEGGCPRHEDLNRIKLGLGTGPMESRDVGQSLRLSALGSYEEFYKTISQHVWQGNIRETKQYAL